MMNEEDLKAFVTSHTETKRVPCPMCSNDRKKRRSDLQITVEVDRVLYQCWHCGLSGAAKKGESPVWKSPVTAISVPKKSDDGMIKEYLETRGIDYQDVKDYRIVSSS